MLVIIPFIANETRQARRGGFLRCSAGILVVGDDSDDCDLFWLMPIEPKNAMGLGRVVERVLLWCAALNLVLLHEAFLESALMVTLKPTSLKF